MPGIKYFVISLLSLSLILPLESHQNPTEIYLESPEKRRGRPKRSLSEEEKKERKRLHDARYRRNKNLEIKQLKDENIMLKSMLKATGNETLGLHELLPNEDIMHGFPSVLGQNQSLTHPPQPQDDFHTQLSFVTQNDGRSQSLVDNQSNTCFQVNNPQIPLSDVVQNDAATVLEQSQILTQPGAVPACCFTFVEKWNGDDRSDVSYSDLKTLLQGETREIRGYRIPLLLQPIFENIVTSYGDVTKNSVLSSFCAENVLLQFLATIKEMGDTSIEQVTEDLIFKWKGCILDAQCIKFDVEFAIKHLAKIVKSYLSRVVRKQLSNIDKRIEVLEMKRDDLKRQKLEIDMFQSQELLGSQEFQGNVGLF